MSTLELLAWIIGFGNPLAATLHGPALARWLTRTGRHHLVEPAQGTAWAVLFATQCTFLAFGIISALGGFRWAQGLMIPVAALNFAVWWKYRPSASTPLQRFTAALNEAKRAGAITVQRIPEGAAEVYADGKMIGYATNLRITPLDAEGNPIGDYWSVSSRAEALDLASVATGVTITTTDRSNVDMVDTLAGEYRERAAENYRADLRRWQEDAATTVARGMAGVAEQIDATRREQCTGAVPSLGLSAPERCADETDHEGECAP
jgi:hypothetical protein